MKYNYEYVVVGSGCSGSMVAQTLLEGGAEVCMLDVGETNHNKATIPPKDQHFTDLRKQDPNQYKYLLGERLEGVSWGNVGKGEQITPPRKHILHSVDEYIPLKSDTFFPLESLGYGGLGIGWGLQCWQYSDSDMAAAGLPIERMREAYEVVSDRIGISATKDDASRYTMGTLQNYQPSATMDANHRLMHSAYEKNKSAINKVGVHLGRTPLALLTQGKDNRSAYSYKDMDYYSDTEKSAWRPWITVDELKKNKHFIYINNRLVTSFVDKKDGVTITCTDLTTGKSVMITCRTLILASNPIESARIVLRSFKAFNQRQPLLCNPYTYIPCIQPKLIGKSPERKRLGYAQLSLFLDEQENDTDTSVASLYDYYSLMLFRIVRQVPLNFSDARAIMQYLSSGVEIMGVHHPDKQSDLKYIELVKDDQSITGDSIHAEYALSSEDKAEYTRREKKFIKIARKLHTFALKRIDPGYGASIHYAGTIPFSATPKKMTLDPSGRLHKTYNVYVADSSGFTYLPSRGLTFSLMANAHLVAENILKEK